MIIQMDTREKVGKKKHILSYFEQNDIKVIRSKMYVGDWTRLDNQTVCIDTKTLGLQEVYQNLVQSHKRFRDECIRAKDAEISLIVLVEQNGIRSLDDVAKWRNKRYEDWVYIHNAQEHGKMMGAKISKKPPVSSERLMNMMKAMTMNYGVEWQFCSKSQTGKRIVKILEGVSVD